MIMKSWIFRISIALNILVIVLVLGVWLNKAKFIRAYLAGIYTYHVSFFDSFPLVQGDVVMLGDSITDRALWDEIFPEQQVKNRGIGGDTTSGVLLRLESITEAKPAALFLKIGTNDLTHGPGLEESYKQYREIVARVQVESPATEIYLQSILPRQAKYREKVEAFNREIQQVAVDLRVTYIDLYTGFLAPDSSIADELAVDELHLSGKGYRLWQSLLQPYMAEH
jgi:hexosaminidase